MNSIIRLNLATTRRFTIATTFGALVALGVAGVALTGSVTSAVAAPVDTRDHRTKPVVRDHVNGTVIRDHTGGSVPVPPSKKRGTQCLGNLCHVKVCTSRDCI
jgi:hypothetical protein